MKRATLFVLAAAALAAVVPARPAAAKELAGVNMPETLSVGDKTLKLNGIGLRKKAIFKVYVGGLYLEAPSKDAAAILASDAPKAVRMTFLRDVSKSSCQGRFVEGFENNAKEKAAAQKAAIEKLYGLDPGHEGDPDALLHVRPGQGNDRVLRRQGARPHRGQGVRRGALRAVARPEAPVRGPQEGNARLNRAAPRCRAHFSPRSGFDLVENEFQEAPSDPLLERGRRSSRPCAASPRAGQKPRLQDLAGAADGALKRSRDPPRPPRLRWTILKEAVRAGATPSTPDGFHRLFEEVSASAWPERPSLTSLLGRFKFREAKDPLDGLARAEKAEAWLPFETGKVFAMAGRGAGKVVETNFALNVVRLDFESAKGVAVPIGIASPAARRRFRRATS